MAASRGAHAVSNGLVCPVTALCFVSGPPDATGRYLCVGVGPALRIYPARAAPGDTDAPRGEPLVSAEILPVAIHGLRAFERRAEDARGPCLVVRGNRYVALTRAVSALVAHAPAAVRSGDPPSRETTACRSFPEWVLDAAFVRAPRALVVVSLATGALHVADSESLSVYHVISCREPELFWSLTLSAFVGGRACDAPAVPGDEGRALCLSVAAGTSFGNIVEWTAFVSQEVSCEAGVRNETVAVQSCLTGHDGPVMSLARLHCEPVSWLASASVDRSVRLWRKSGRAPYSLFSVFYGHTARVWQVAFCPQSHEGQADGDGRRIPSLVSVGEDRTLRLWRSRAQPEARSAVPKAPGRNSKHLADVYHGHAGRNVWSVAVSPGGRPASAIVATGGDDGQVQLRDIDFSAEEERGSIAAPIRDDDVAKPAKPFTQRPSDGRDTGFPRLSRAGLAEEAVQSICMDGPHHAIVSTSYGRLLRGYVGPHPISDWRVLLQAPEGGFVAREIPHNDTGEKEAFEVHLSGVVFAPNTLALMDGIVSAGTVDGRVILFDLVTAEFYCFVALVEDPVLVSGIFLHRSHRGRTQDTQRTFELLAASLSGSLYHYQVHYFPSESDTLATKFTHSLCTVYASTRRVRHGQITSVAFLDAPLPCLLVGDRRGFIHMYELCQAPPASADATHIPVCSTPLAFCRTNQDRVSVIAPALDHASTAKSVPASDFGPRDDAKFGCEGPAFVTVLVAGFDGRLVEVFVSHSRASDGKETYSTLTLGSSLRCAEHLDTLTHLSLSKSSFGAKGLLANSSPIVVGFRSSQLLAWDVSNRVLLLRVDVGGWRRALGLHLGTSQETTDCTVAFWRSGVLRSAHASSSGTCSLGVGFHGLRAHGAAVIPRLGTVTILTASEDTTLRETRIGTPWSSSQILSGHTSGATCVSAVTLDEESHDAVAVSGGGMDEVGLWVRARDTGRWGLRKMLQTRGEQGAPTHRVLCLAVCRGASAQSIVPGADVACLIGRSDGSVSGSSVGDTVEEAWRVGGAHKGAVLCVAFDDGLAASGDSAGTLALWAPGGERLDVHCCAARAHSGGVNCVAVRRRGAREAVVASGGDDGSVRLWRATAGGAGAEWALGAAALAARSASAVVGVALTTHGSWAVSVAADQVVRGVAVDGARDGRAVARARTAVADPAGVAVVCDGGGGRARVAVFGAGLQVLRVAPARARHGGAPVHAPL